MNDIVNITPGITLWSLILLVEIGLGFILLYFLIRVSTKLKWYLPLAVYVVLVIIESYSEFLLQTNYIIYTPHFLYVCEPFYLLVGPSIYLYARGQEYQKLKFFKSDLLFIAPFLLSILTYIPFYALTAEEKMLEYMQYGDLDTDIENFIWEWIFLVSLNFTFFAVALRRFQNYNEKIKALYSDIQKKDFKLTQLLIKLCMVIYAMELVSVLLSYYDLPFSLVLYNLYDIFQVVILILIGYDALTSLKNSEEIQKGWQKIHMEEGQSLVLPIKYANSNLTHEQSSEIKTKIEEYMEKHEPYLNSQMRVKDLAEQTEISSHQISQVLNESFQQNFYEFVNTYRVRKAKTLLDDPKNESLTFTAIGFDAGFNSKTTFYNAFKKETGTTPAQYKSRLNNSGN